MKKEQNIVLKLSEHFKSSISSRAAVINLFAVDLANKKSAEVYFRNIDTEVKTMFDIVNKSIESPQPKVSDIHRVHFSSQKEFSNFLLRI